MILRDLEELIIYINYLYLVSIIIFSQSSVNFYILLLYRFDKDQIETQKYCIEIFQKVKIYSI